MNDICKQMNEDIFHGVDQTTYDVSPFNEITLQQAKENFHYNGYKLRIQDKTLYVKKA